MQKHKLRKIAVKRIAHCLPIVIAAMALCAPDAMAAGRKLITNSTPYPVQVVLIIRSGDDPKLEAGTKDVRLDPRQSLWVEYGTPKDIYLQGIRLEATFNGERIASQYIVITREGALDNEFNRHNAFDIGIDHGTFRFSTREVR